MTDITLIRMQDALALVKDAYAMLLAADGLDEVLDDLTSVHIRLGAEIREYKEHTYGIINDGCNEVQR